MQVTHVQDHVTSAVISGAQAIDFAISDSPEFFNILSSTLYSDQILAVVRETLCNAWDAHLEFKLEDRAVEISLDEKHLIIRDFGPGIPKNKIGPVYGTYGGSTKVLNGKVTGGFGLGCKSPFAYVDDFEVTSFCDGERTIYRLSKSNAEVGGKPSIIPVVSTPTSESGLQVKLAIKNETDRRRFAVLIRRIVQNGAMNMKLNGELLDSLPFNDMVHGFMLTKNQTLEAFSPIVIRYGNVIYPIERDEFFASQWDDVTKFLTRMVAGTGYHARNGSWTLVLQAAPNTVSVTPSRESLSLQKHTLNTIRELMIGFLKTRDKELQVECFKLLDDQINETWLNASPAVLFETEEQIPNLYKPQRMSNGALYKTGRAEYKYDLENNLTNFPQFVRQYAHSSYPDFQGFRKTDILKRLNALVASGFNGKKAILAFRRAYLRSFKTTTKHRRSGQQREVQSPWFAQHVLWPLMKGMTPESGLKASKLFVYGAAGRSYSHDRQKVMAASSFQSNDLINMMPFLRNIVILSFNKMDVVEGGADDFAICKYWLGNAENSLVYVVPRADAKVEEARAFFKAAGVNLIDLTVKQQAEYKVREAKVITGEIVKKPKKTGIPKLSACVNSNGDFFNRAADYNDKIARTQNPKFIVKDGRRNEYKNIEGLNEPESKLLLKLYGDEGALCANQNQFDRYKTLGAIDWSDYVLNNLVEEYETNPLIREYLAFDLTRVDTGYGSSYRSIGEWATVIRKDQDLLEYFGLVDNRTDHDKDLMKMWAAFERNHISHYGEQYKAVQKAIKEIKIDSAVTELFEILRKSKLLQVMDCSGTSSVLLHWEANLLTTKYRDLTRDLLVQAIEG